MKKLVIALTLIGGSTLLARADNRYTTTNQGTSPAYEKPYAAFELKSSWTTTLGHAAKWGLGAALPVGAGAAWLAHTKNLSDNLSYAAGGVAALTAGYLSYRFGAATYFFKGKGLLKSLDLEFLEELAGTGKPHDVIALLERQFRREKYLLPAALDALHLMNVTLVDAQDQFVQAYQRGSNPTKCQEKLDLINIYSAAIARAKQIIRDMPEFAAQQRARDSEQDLASKDQMAQAQAKIAKTQRGQFIFEVIRASASGIYQVITDSPTATAMCAAALAYLNYK